MATTAAFLSYARSDDEPFVARLHADLTRRGLTVWWDRRDMPSRALTFLQEIRDAIDRCDHLIAVVGPHAARSEYVLAEWRWATLFSKRVVPVLRVGDHGLLPTELSRLHAPDFRDDRHYDDALAELVRILSEPEPALGELKGVPTLSAHFAPPTSALNGLSTLILGDVEAPLTLAPPIVVLHGMGGAGKSSLAAALARRAETRRAFPDGIVWLNFGSEAEARQGALALGRALGVNAALLADPEQGTVALQKALAARSCLIVADDVWSVEAIQPVANALGQRCRLLVTARDGGLVTSLSAAGLRVDALTAATSLELLASWVATPVVELPGAAAVLAARCGHLPLALAICGALVADGLSWSDLRNALDAADLTFIGKPLLNYPYRTVFAALNVSVDFLARREPLAVRRYRDLAVFPPGQRVPQRAVITFWQGEEVLSEWEARRLLNVLVHHSLISLERSGADGSVTLHTLQHDFLRALLGADLAGLHARWVGTYARLSAGRWAAGPNDGYFFQYLPWHLIQLGRQEEAAALLLDPDWLEGKVHAAGFASLLTDFAWLADDTDLRALRDALRLGGKGIVERPAELPAQVRNRLLGLTSDRLRAFLERPPGRVWLRALLPTLSQAAGPLLLSFVAHARAVEAVAPVDGGRNILTGGGDGRVVVWDGVTGTPVRVLAEGSPIRAMAVSPGADGRAVVVRQRFEVIDTDTGSIVARLDVPTERVGDVAISEDGGTVLYATFDNEAHVWNTRNDRCYWLHSLPTPLAEAGILSVGFLPADGTLVTAESSVGRAAGIVRFWNPVNRRARGSAPCAQQPRRLAVAADGRTIAFADGILGLRVVLTGAHTRQLVGVLTDETRYVNGVREVAFSDDDGQIIGGTAQGEILLWDRATSTRVACFRAHETAIEVVASLPGARLATTAGGTLRVWDRTRLHEAPPPVHDHPVSALAISPDNRTVVCGSLDSTLSVWSLGDGVRMLGKFGGHQGGVASIALSARDGRMATGGGDGQRDIEVRFWNLARHTRIAEARLDEDRALAIAFTTDETRLVVGSLFDVRVFRLPELTEEHAIPVAPSDAPSAAVYAIAVSADELAFAGCEQGDIVVEDLRAGAIVRRWRAHGGGIHVVSLLPDDRLLSASQDGTVKIWRRNGELMQTLSGTGDAIRGGGATPDGSRAVTSGSSGVLTVWDLESATAVATFTFDAPLWPSAISGDGRTVIAGDWAGRVHFLSVET